jgi:NO-binding membrane sensor protein with MHYT domain
MAVTYDPALIALSLVIAVFGAHTGLWLAARMDGAIGVARKALLAGAAIAIGGGIWSMHFVGMLALSLPVTITYDVLLTLISALLSILVTGVGLAVVGSGTPGWPRLAVGGVFMGGGIAIMHYVGMAAVRANCVILWDRGLIGASVLIAVAAATAALWTAFARTGPKRRVAASVVLGLAIAGMHYTGMAAATFLPADVLIALAAPALSPSLLAIVVAVATFLIFGFTLLTAVPDRSPAPASAPVPLPAGAAVPEALTPAAPRGRRSRDRHRRRRTAGRGRNAAAGAHSRRTEPPDPVPRPGRGCVDPGRGALHPRPHPRGAVFLHPVGQRAGAAARSRLVPAGPSQPHRQHPPCPGLPPAQ